jgi:hypothetical protein
MKIRLITILIVVLTLLLSASVPVALAKNDPVQHHNQEDMTVPANCHSRHARDAGMGCGTDEEPSTEELQLPPSGTEPDNEPVTRDQILVPKPHYPPLLTGGGGGGQVRLVY